MTMRQKLYVVLGTSLLAAACSSPVAPKGCSADPILIGSSYCAAK